MKNFKRINKVYFSLLCFFTMSVYFFSLKKANINNLEFILFSTIFILVILIFNFLFLIKYQINFYPINILFNLYFLVSFLFFLFNFDYVFQKTYPSLFNTLSKKEFYFLVNESVKILSLIGFFFNIGFYLIFKYFNNTKINVLPELNEIDFLRLNFFLLLIKLILILSFYFFNIKIAEIENPLTLLIALSSFYLIIIYKNNYIINFLIIFFIFLENSILTFSVYKNALLFVAGFVIIYNLKKKISLFLISVLILWVIFGQSYKVKLRDNFQLNENYSISKKSDEINIITKYDVNPVILRLTEPVVSLIRIMEFEKIRKKNVQNDTLSILAYSPIPRFLYKNKPKQDFAVWYTSYFFDIYRIDELKKTVTYNIFWPSDLYINFGFNGLIIGSLIFGIFLSLLLSIFTKYNQNNIQYILGISVFANLSFPDFNISLMLSPIFLQLLILFLILKFIIYFLKLKN